MQQAQIDVIHYLPNRKSAVKVTSEPAFSIHILHIFQAHSVHSTLGSSNPWMHCFLSWMSFAPSGHVRNWNPQRVSRSQPGCCPSSSSAATAWPSRSAQLKDPPAAGHNVDQKTKNVHHGPGGGIFAKKWQKCSFCYFCLGARNDNDALCDKRHVAYDSDSQQLFPEKVFVALRDRN